MVVVFFESYIDVFTSRGEKIRYEEINLDEVESPEEFLSDPFVMIMPASGEEKASQRGGSGEEDLMTEEGLRKKMREMMADLPSAMAREGLSSQHRTTTPVPSPPRSRHERDESRERLRQFLEQPVVPRGGRTSASGRQSSGKPREVQECVPRSRPTKRHRVSTSEEEEHEAPSRSRPRQISPSPPGTPCSYAYSDVLSSTDEEEEARLMEKFDAQLVSGCDVSHCHECMF